MRSARQELRLQEIVCTHSKTFSEAFSVLPSIG